MIGGRVKWDSHEALGPGPCSTFELAEWPLWNARYLCGSSSSGTARWKTAEGVWRFIPTTKGMVLRRVLWRLVLWVCRNIRDSNGTFSLLSFVKHAILAVSSNKSWAWRARVLSSISLLCLSLWNSLKTETLWVLRVGLTFLLKQIFAQFTYELTELSFHRLHDRRKNPLCNLARRREVFGHY